MRKFVTFQEVPKIEQISPRCDLEPIRGQRLEPEWWTFASQGPQGAATSTRTRQKKEGKRQKERRSKKERKKERGEWKRVKEGSEHASGQRPCEFSNVSPLPSPSTNQVSKLTLPESGS